ncbi:MAG: hypothetical protein C0412_07630 [Flavobacterium sp.]|nr:hypothetical protein [Flavobacterium sp.]
MTNLFHSSYIVKLITVILFISSSLSFASDTLTVAGINGFIFQEKDSDYKISVTSSFKLHQMTLLPKGITLQYTFSNKTFKIYGKAKIILENDSILVSIGDSLNPGIIITNRILENVNLSISSSFNLKKVKVIPQNLTFKWNKGAYSYKMYGAIEIEIDSQKTTALLGTEANPGIEIDSSKIKYINIGVTGKLNLKSLSIKPKVLTVNWDSGNSQYKMYGDICVMLMQDSLEANLGTLEKPGVLIREGKLINLDISLTANFQLKKLTFKPNRLTFVWDEPNKRIRIYGDAKVKIENDSLSVALGSSTNPGIQITNGIIDTIDVKVTGKFVIKSLQVKPDSLAFVYNSQSSSYKMFGAIYIVLSKDSLYARFGTKSNPGIVITDGRLVKLDVSLTADFELKKLTFKPKGLNFIWDEPKKQISISGNVMVKIEKDSIAAVLGSPTSAGIKITNGIIDTIDVKVSGKFVLKSLAIKPDSLAFIYDRDSSQYKIFGRIEIDVEKDTIKGQLGTYKKPGISIKEGKVDHINISVSSHFELKKLTIETDSLGIEWYKNGTGDIYNFFGKVKIDIDSNKIAFDFGNRASPGLVFNSGKIQSLKISTTDDIHFAGFEVATKNLTIEYSNLLYHMYGKILLKKMWSAEIDLGNGPGSGVTLDLSIKPAKLKIESAKFELADIDLGPITLKNMELDLAQNEVQMARLKVKLPPGWEVDAMMGFKFVNNHLEIDSIDIAWEATNIENSIEIPGSGAFIMKLEGGLFGIEDPHEFTVEGDIGIAVGGAFNIPDIGEVAFLYLEAGVSISRSEFKLSSSAKIGAYKDNNDKWIPVLGDGRLDLDFKWNETYSIHGKLNIPSGDWTVLSANLDAIISGRGSISADIGVYLKIPKKIPIVGGKEFAEAVGVIRYDKYDPNSYAAGWAKVNLGFFKLNAGVKYTFQTKDYTTLGAKEINNISSSIYIPPTPHVTPSTPPAAKHLSEFIKIKVDESPNYVQVKIKFNKNSTRNGLFIETDNPLGTGKSNMSPIYFVTGTDLINQSGMNITTVPTYQIQTFYKVDSLTFYIMAPGYKDNMDATLPNAEYTVSIIHPENIVMLNSFEVHQMFRPPYAHNEVMSVKYSPFNSSRLPNMLTAPKLSFKASAYVYDNDTAVVNLLYAKHLNENGTLIKSVKYSEYWGTYPPDGECFKIDDLDFPQNFAKGDSLFIYYTIDDMINSLYKSPVQYCNYTAPFNAKVNVIGMPDSLASGIETTLYIQDPVDNNWYMPDSLTRFTNKNGLVSFPYSVSANAKIKFVFDIPVGYKVDPSSAYQNEQIAFASGSLNSCGKNVSITLRKKINNGDLYVR